MSGSSERPGTPVLAPVAPGGRAGGAERAVAEGARWSRPAMLALGAGTLWHVAWLPVWLLLLLAGMAGWRLWADRHGWGVPPRLAVWLLALLILLGLWGEFQDEVFGPDAASLIVAMGWLKLLEVRDRRDATVVSLIGCFLPVSAAVLAFSFAAAIWQLLALGVALTCLWWCRVGGGAWGRAARGAAGLLGRAAVPALVLLLLMPRPDVRGALERLGTGWDRTGLSETLAPGSVARLQEETSMALRARFPGGEPPAGPWYWRAVVLWENAGDLTWRPGDCRSTAALEPAGAEERAGSVRVDMLLEPHGLPWLVALDRPVTVPEGARFVCGRALALRGPLRRRRAYEVWSDPGGAARKLPAAHRRLALALPEDLAPRVRRLARELRGPDAETTVARILGHFAAEGFEYTLEPGRLDGEAISSFLFDRRQGFCEHYAGAMATLARAAGMPARVVLGFAGGTWNPVGQHVSVRRSAAHAWCEIWMEDRGWVRVDPSARLFDRTPGQAAREPDAAGGGAGRRDGGAGSGGGMDLGPLQWIRLTAEAIEARWDAIVLGYDQARRRALLERWGLAPGTGASWWLVGAGGGLGVGVVLLFSSLCFRWRYRREATRRAWEHFLRRMARRGVGRRSGEPPLAFAARAAEALPERREAIEAFMAQWLPARYGAGPRPGFLEARRLSRQARRL